MLILRNHVVNTKNTALNSAQLELAKKGKHLLFAFARY